MNIKIFYSLICLTLTLNAFGADDKKNTADEQYFLAKLLLAGGGKVMNLFEDRGKGKQALKQVDQLTKTIEQKDKTIEKMASTSCGNTEAKDILSMASNSANLIRSGYGFYGFVTNIISPDPEEHLRKKNAAQQINA